MLGVDEAARLLLVDFIALLTDNESEVRAVIARKVYAFTKNLPPATQAQIIITQIIPPLEVGCLVRLVSAHTMHRRWSPTTHSMSARPLPW